ncbi:MAG TPA: EamA family transporter [Jatrophihabitans sp.]|jgi:drug/metabolite transporter (DMT)-like permease|uniref:EamA family transporter n=1 Tax=Jatrophihabitans sp. TaxID=1932789 RepID=UPI002EF0F5D1
MQIATRQRAGLGTALLSAAAFGTSGAFATALIGSGWSPAAAVTARLLVAAAVLSIPALIVLRGRFGVLAREGRSITGYGVIAIAVGQLCYFNAVARLSVGVALLLEYLGILLVVGWLWLRHGHRPRRLTVAGAAAAMVGLALVLDVTGSHRLDPIGVLWGLGAAVGLAVYFVVSARADTALPPIAMAWAGMAVASLCLVAIGVLGVLPIHANTADVQLLHHRTSWLVPVLGISLVAAVFAYAAGIKAARALGAKLASFLGLSEVLFAVLFAWLLLGQLPGLPQIVGGVFIIAGVALVQWDELRTAESSTAEPSTAEPSTIESSTAEPSTIESNASAGAEASLVRPLVAAAEPERG